MKRFIRGILVVMLAAGTAVAQDKKPDDVLQKRDGGIVVGRITKLDDAFVEILVNSEKEPRKISLKELNPYSVYKLRLDRIDKTNGEARMSLAEFCMANGLYYAAAREFEEAARLDKSLEEKARKRREEAHNEDARSKFEEAAWPPRRSTTTPTRPASCWSRSTPTRPTSTRPRSSSRRSPRTSPRRTRRKRSSSRRRRTRRKRSWPPWPRSRRRTSCPKRPR